MAMRKPRPVVDTWDDEDDMVALRDVGDLIAKKLADPDCSTRDTASLSKRLMEIRAELKAAQIEKQEAERKRTAGPRMVSASSDEEWTGV
jgi:hypothetical protein